MQRQDISEFGVTAIPLREKLYEGSPLQSDVPSFKPYSYCRILKLPWQWTCFPMMEFGSVCPIGYRVPPGLLHSFSQWQPNAPLFTGVDFPALRYGIEKHAEKLLQIWYQHVYNRKTSE